jgi:aerobic-type carbon monoxide dehydrogenase small subunit (CoxS/CutS family)
MRLREAEMTTVKLRVNGVATTVQVDDPDTPLRYVLRNDLDLTGTRFGCGLAQCGYCTAGIVMTSRARLDRNPRPTEAEVREALTAISVAAGAHVRVIRAVMRAAGGRS